MSSDIYGNGQNDYIFTNKDRIYQFIKKNPGVHLRRIKKELDLAMGDIQYNLNVLEQLDLIKFRKWGLYKHYFVKSISGNRTELVLAMLQQETPRGIMLYLIENPGASQKKLAQYLEFSSPTIKWHVSKLLDMDLIYARKENRSKKYYLKGNIVEIITLMRSYHPSLWHKLSNSLTDIFIELGSATRCDDYDESKSEQENKVEYTQQRDGSDDSKIVKGG